MNRTKRGGFEGKHPMVRVEWEDATSLGGWRTPEEIEEQPVLGCVSIGYVVREDEKILTLAGTYDTKYADGRGHDMNHCHIILKANIQKVERLRVAGGHKKEPGKCSS